MYLETESYEDCQEEARQAEQVLNAPMVLPAEVKEDQILKKQRWDILRDVSAAVGMKSDVIKDGPARVGGLADNNNRIYVSKNALVPEKYDLALKIVGHEAIHIRTGHRELDVEGELIKENPEYLEILYKVLGKSKIDGTFLNEGFTEYLSERSYGYNEWCLYNEDEVPAAKKLESLCLQNTRESLLSAYEKRDKQLFFKRLKVLCAMLLIKEQVNQVTAGKEWN